MRLKLFLAGLLALPAIGLTPLIASRPAAAVCVMTDIGIQLQISGTQTPGYQENNVNMGTDGSCWGNSTTNAHTQTYIGGGDSAQIRNSTHFAGSGGYAPFGLNIDPVTTSVHVPVDVYSPVHDEDFMNSLGF